MKPLQPRTAKAVFGISSHVLALLQQSGTSPEALAELAGITAPAPCKPGQQSSGRKDLSTGSTRWDVEPAVCWAGVCGGHKPRASLADQLEGRSQLPFSEQQTSSTLGGGRLRESLEAEMDHMQVPTCSTHDLVAAERLQPTCIHGSGSLHFPALQPDMLQAHNAGECVRGCHAKGGRSHTPHAAVLLKNAMDAMQDEDPERRRRSTDGPRPEGPFKEIVTVAHTGSGPGLVQDSPWSALPSADSHSAVPVLELWAST